MARIRSIKPEFWKSEAIAELSIPARLTFIGLWTYVDDNGVGRDVERLIAAELYPLEDDPIATLDAVSRDLAELADHGRIVRYVVAGKPYLAVTGWSEHQRIDKPNKARYPGPETADDLLTSGYGESRETLAEPSRNPREIPSPGVGEGAGEQGSKERESTAPTSSSPRGSRIPEPFEISDEMKAWVVANDITPQQALAATASFVDYWRGVSGSKGVKLDWPATWRNWLRREFREGRSGRPLIPAARPPVETLGGLEMDPAMGR